MNGLPMISRGVFGWLVLCIMQGLAAQPVYHFVKSFELESGLVEYALSGGQQGQVILWWDDYGRLYREEVVLNGQPSSIAMADGRYFYHLNMQSLQGNKYLAEAAMEVQQYFDAIHEVHPRGREKVLGYVCDMVEKGGIITSYHRGIPMRVREGSGTVLEEVVRVEMHLPAEPSLFIPPAEVQLVDATRDLLLEIMPRHDAGEGYLHAEEAAFPEAITFEQFVAACKHAAGQAGYRLLSQGAYFGMYFSQWENEEGARLHFDLRPLSAGPASPTESTSEGTTECPREGFDGTGMGMSFRTEVFYDEELGVQARGSLLLVEIPAQDVLLEISAIPEMDERALVSLFRSWLP